MKLYIVGDNYHIHEVEADWGEHPKCFIRDTGDRLEQISKRKASRTLRGAQTIAIGLAAEEVNSARRRLKRAQQRRDRLVTRFEKEAAVTP